MIYDIEQENGKTDSDNEDDSIGIAIATMFNETTEEQQENASSETASIFTTPDKRNTSSMHYRTTEKSNTETEEVTIPYLLPSM
jgi:hypothetical protein